MTEKKVLIIAYYWPPSGGSGVQRWLKFVKYLPSFGWTPHVFTPENPSFAVKDESLLKDVPAEAEVIRFPIWEPYDAFFKLTNLFGKKKTAKPTDLVSKGKQSTVQKVSTWIRGNFFIPDPRVFWVRPASKFLDDYIKSNNIRTIITTGPPHSIHLIGLKLKKKNPSVKWIADFRDPWSEWGFLDSLMISSFVRSKHKRLERQVLKSADDVVTITPFYVRQFATLGERKVHLLTNGFDEDDFRDVKIERPLKFTIRHVGIINEKCDPRPFMEAVRGLIRSNPSFASDSVIEFIGEIHPQFQAYVKGIPELNAITSFPGSLPHKKLLTEYGRSSVLVLVLTGYKDAEGYMPGKLFEYLATGLPVLGVGPENGDAASLLRETNAGSMIDGNHSKAIQDFLSGQFERWQKGAPVAQRGGFTKYSRREITQQLTHLFAE
jgi:glycosyltransferase involved in cell wall biosynthesis